MNITQAHEDAALVDRHHCLHVELIANGVGMLCEMGIEPPAFSMRATAWFLLVRHDGDKGIDLIATDSPIERVLMNACWEAMSRHAMGGLTLADLTSETEAAPVVTDRTWRCPVHEARPWRLDDRTPPSQIARQPDLWNADRTPESEVAR